MRRVAPTVASVALMFTACDAGAGYGGPGSTASDVAVVDAAEIASDVTAGECEIVLAEAARHRDAAASLLTLAQHSLDEADAVMSDLLAVEPPIPREANALRVDVRRRADAFSRELSELVAVDVHSTDEFVGPCSS